MGGKFCAKYEWTKQMGGELVMHRSTVWVGWDLRLFRCNMGEGVQVFLLRGGLKCCNMLLSVELLSGEALVPFRGKLLITFTAWSIDFRN